MSNEAIKMAGDGQPMPAQPVGGKLPTELSLDEFSAASYEKWKEEATAALKGASFDKSMYTGTYEGIQLEPLYTKDHVKEALFAETRPGVWPMRGSSASGYIVQPWEVVQPSYEKLPADAHRQMLNDLEKGATTAAVHLDANVLNGIDEPSDDSGVSIASLSDVEELLDGFWDKPLCIFAGVSAAPLIGFVTDLAAKKGVATGRLKGCIGADPIGMLLKNGSSPDLELLFDEMAETIKWAEKYAPHLRTVMIRGSVFHNAGANAVQDVAYSIAYAIALIRAMQARGVDAGAFAGHMRFGFSMGSNFFMETAKIRAARNVWAQVAEAFGLSGEEQRAEIFGRTSFFTKTVYDPYVNMLRNTTEAFSGVLGGVDGMMVGCFDEAFCEGGEFSRRIARNTQILLQKEFNLIQPVDPAGGSWYVEALTDTLSQKIWAMIQDIETKGGFIKNVCDGSIQKEINAVLQERFKKLAKRSDRAVGTNIYPNPAEPKPEYGSACSTSITAGSKALKAFKDSRSQDAVQKALSGVDHKNANLVAAIAAAARAGATLGDVRTKLSGNAVKVSAPVLGTHRWTEQYEAMRRRTDDFVAKTGGNLKVFLANMGTLAQHKARADFITSFMEVAAFDIITNDGYETPDECVAAAVKSGADIAVICSTDATYPELVPVIAKGIKAKCPAMKVCLAGAPAEEHKDSYVSAGVDDFISVRSDCLATLTGFQKAKGML